MPVPISVTHPKGAGLSAATPATLETAGPFARLKAAAEKAAAEQQQQQQSHSTDEVQQQQSSSQSQPQQQHQAQNGICINGSAAEEQHTVAVDHLTFSYPGLGEWRDT